MATKKKSEFTPTKPLRNVEWPKVERGTHLTVYTYEDGTTKLEWDDEALLSEVRNAILKHESNIPTTAVKKSTKRKPKE